MSTDNTDNPTDDVDAESDGDPSLLTRIGSSKISRRSALTGLGAAAGASSMGAASATEVIVNDITGNGVIQPGDNVPVLDFNLDSDDEIIDVSGGDGLSDALYDTVTDNVSRNGDGGDISRHPQPAFGDTGQEVTPGDVLSEFSTQDRVFTSAYYDFNLTGGEDTEADHLFQAAGFTDGATEIDEGLTNYDTPYVCEFIPYGYTASDGIGADCVSTYDPFPDEISDSPEEPDIPTAFPFGFSDFSTDICEVINPQFSVKVDSAGVGQDMVEADMSGYELPYTAADVEDENGTIGTPDSDASDEAIIVDQDGAVPPAAQGNGYDIVYDSDSDTVFIGEDGDDGVSDFPDHREDVTLPNSGYLSAVTSCSVPRGDVAPCEEFECTGEDYGKERATSGTEDTSQLGLQSDFNSLNDGNFVRLDGVSRDTSDKDVLVLSNDYEPDEEELNGNTGFVDTVSVSNVSGDTITGTTLERQSRVSQASAQPLAIPSELERDGDPVPNVSPADNGFIQVPVNGEAEPQNTFATGDPFKIADGPGVADDAHLLSRGATTTTDNVADLVDDSDTSVFLTESDAYRELDLDALEAYVPLATGSATPTVDAVSSAAKYGAAVVNDSLEFDTPTQILVGGRFNCDSGTPLEMGSEELVDITHNESVSFEINEEASNSQSISSRVNDDGVFMPVQSDVSGTEVVVDVLYDGCLMDQVAILVENADAIGSIDTVTVRDLRSVPDASPSSLLEPQPVGEDVQAVAAATPNWTNASAPIGSNGFEIDLTRATNPADGTPATTFTASGNGVSGVTDTGLATIETTSPTTSDQSGSITATTAVSGILGLEFGPNDNSPSDYTANPDYFFAGAGWPGRDDNYYDDLDGQTLVLVGVEDADDSATVDDDCLDEPGLIATALQESINAAIEDQAHAPSVQVRYYTTESDEFSDPVNHSAEGYLIWSDTRVESSFDQSVDVSSVEIENFATLVGDKIQLSDLEIASWSDLEQQDIAPALGLADAPNASADTVTFRLDDFGGNTGAIYFDTEGDGEANFQLGFNFENLTATAFGNASGSWEEDTAFRSLGGSPASFDSADEVTSGGRNGNLTGVFSGEIDSDGAILIEVDFSALPSAYDITDPVDTFSYGVRDPNGPNRDFEVDPDGWDFDATNDEVTGDVLTLTGGSAFNSVNAETIVNDTGVPTPGSTDYDRYSPRTDPLGLVTATLGNEFLGANELTCNDLALGECLMLLGGECPDDTTDLHEDEYDVLLFYDSEYGPVLEPDTDLEGAPNVTDNFEGVTLEQQVRNNTLNRWRDIQGSNSSEADVAPLPFYEAFDVLEVKDSIIDEKMVGEWDKEGSDFSDCKSVPETQVRPAGGVERGLTPDETVVHNVYGDQFNGLAVRNQGSVDLTQVREHSLSIGNASERDWIHGGQLIGIEGASRDPEWPQNRPDLVAFVGQTYLGGGDSPFDGGVLTPSRASEELASADPSYLYEFYYQYTWGSSEFWAFTDDQEETIWFGTNSQTTCDVAVEDDLNLVVNARTSNDIQEGETLEYEVPPLYDRNSDGNYNAVRPGAADGATGATFQDRGLFFESHDDQGELATDTGQVVIGEALPPEDPGDEFPCDSYQCEGGQVTTGGLLTAIEDWRNNDITAQELLDAISSWRDR